MANTGGAQEPIASQFQMLKKKVVPRTLFDKYIIKQLGEDKGIHRTAR